MAEPAKRCPRCGTALPEGFSYCPACSILCEKRPVGKSRPSRAAVLRSRIILITGGVVALAMAIILPRIAMNSPAVAEETVTRFTLTAPETASETENETAETVDFSDVTLDTVVVSPGADGHTHLYVQTVTKNAACTEEGIATFTCSVCGDSYTQAIPAVGHVWREATCEEPRTCTVCGLTEGVARGHVFENGICERCGYSLAQENERRAEIDRYEREVSEINASYNKSTEPYRKNKDALEGEIQKIQAKLDSYEKMLKDETDDNVIENVTAAISGVHWQINELNHDLDQVITQINALTEQWDAALQRAKSNHEARLNQIIVLS